VRGASHVRRTFDPGFCGADGWHSWEDNGGWGDYLNYTVCLRHL
jgi:hypothetical protein